MTDIAFLGLGIMGTGMVRNLLKAGHDLAVWNRTTRPLAEELSGAQVAPSISEAVGDRDIVMLCLTGPDAQRAVFYGGSATGNGGADGLIAALTPGKVVIDLTTTDPELTKALAAAVTDKGAAYIDAPVFGSRNEAWEGTLDIVCGGQRGTFDKVRPLLDVLAKSVHYMGPTGSGATMKLVGNLLVAAQILSTGEALSMARKAGLDTDAMMGVLNVTDYSSGVVVGTASATLAGDFSPNFYLKHMLKDARLIGTHAQALGIAAPSAALIAEMYQAALNAGLGDENASALHKLSFTLSGLDTPSA
ncbi:NAD(P)-dependent oxidoreductase [Fodinicurvata sp. EGI_FJ10296]|uniref:NAD(P)-dependent oxidoreductase n=1 Tax=Fodinicurvata sp. EGI_FJ10296 TaxID=3231908 RepID=UPI0034541161